MKGGEKTKALLSVSWIESFFEHGGGEGEGTALFLGAKRLKKGRIGGGGGSNLLGERGIEQKTGKRKLKELEDQQKRGREKEG